MSRIKINVTLDGKSVWSMDAPPAYALERDWHLHETARNVAPGITRAVRDAEVLYGGGDPERPSEKAMRLAHAAREQS